MSFRYPKNWNEIAFEIKQKVKWKCSKCQLQCLRPNDEISKFTLKERMTKTLQVHHANRIPEDNRSENLIPLCTACHLGYHNRGQSNVSPGQLSLFD